MALGGNFLLPEKARPLPRSKNITAKRERTVDCNSVLLVLVLILGYNISR